MPEPAVIRIVIVDDHQIFRAGLRRLLQSEPGFEVVAEASDGAAAVALLRSTAADVLLLDVAMPRMGGLETLRALAGTPIRVVLLTAGIGPADLLQALQLGARGVVLKESAPRTLIEGIHRVIDGKYLIGTGVTDDLVQAIRGVGATPERRYELTRRELDIVAAIVAGRANRDIAEHFGISLQTVKHHLTSIFNKTGVSTRLELALLAVREGLVDPR